MSSLAQSNRVAGGGNSFGGFGGMPGGMPGHHAHGGGRARPRERKKADPIEQSLRLTLEEMYYGCSKNLKLTRTVMRGDVEQRVSETLTIDVKPGWKKGTKITFPEKGDEAPGVIAADIVFVIDEKRHPQFERDGNDLVKTVKVDLRRVSVARASPREEDFHSRRSRVSLRPPLGHDARPYDASRLRLTRPRAPPRDRFVWTITLEQSAARAGGDVARRVSRRARRDARVGRVTIRVSKRRRVE